MERRLTPRGRDRRAQLMDFAAHRFALQGFHPTSVGEIVDGLGVGKGVFYWYFSSKDELFVQILRDAQLDLRRRQQQAIGDEPDPVRRIEAGMRASMAWFAENRHLVTLSLFAATEDRFRPALREGEDVALADIVRHLKEGIVEGTIRDEDPEMLGHAVLGVTSHLARALVHERGESPADVAESAIAFCLDGLRGQAVSRSHIDGSKTR